MIPLLFSNKLFSLVDSFNRMNRNDDSDHMWTKGMNNTHVILFTILLPVFCDQTLFNDCDTEVTQAVTWQWKVGSGGRVLLVI